MQEPEHIHIYVKEPNKTPYYIDNFMFESDPTLTEKIKRNEKKRGGSGIVRLEEKNGIWNFCGKFKHIFNFQHLEFSLRP